MKTLNASLILQKNELATTYPWIILFAIGIDDSTTLRLAAYPEDVPWNGSKWQKFPCVVESMKEESSGRLGGLNIFVANIDRTISAYVENNNILSKNATMYIVHAGNLDVTTGILSFTYRVNRIQITEEVATFELGHEDLMALKLPWQRFIRNRCRFKYKGDQCGYPNDDFDATTEQDLKTGGDGDKGGGWSALNMSNAVACDINQTSTGYLRMSSNSAVYWDDGVRSAPYIYKHFMGDYDIETRFPAFQGNEDGKQYFLVQSEYDYDDWCGFVCGWSDESGTLLDVVNTVNGSSAETTATGSHRYLRIVRDKKVFTFYSKFSATAAWSEIVSIARTDIPTRHRIGFASGCLSTMLFSTYVDYLHVNSGGLSTCDYTMDGANGCRAHENQLRFGGFPSIPYGRLYGI